MNPKLMQEALQKRKAKGLDITILLGAPHEQIEHANHGDGPSDDDEMEQKKLDLAPDATPLGEDQDEKDVALGHLGHHDNMTPGGEITNHSPDGVADKSELASELEKAHLGKQSIAHKMVRRMTHHVPKKKMTEITKGNKY